MILSTSQPYFSPFPGFFLKAFLSDIFVVLDEVQFPRGTTWLTKNRFKNDQGTLWMTVPVWKKGLGLQKISEGFNRVFVGNIFYKNLYPFFSKPSQTEAPKLSALTRDLLRLRKTTLHLLKER